MKAHRLRIAPSSSVMGGARAVAVWTAGITVVLTAISAVLAVTTPPRSGPMCQWEQCVGFPYTDIAAYVPRDYLWMYPTIALELSVVHWWRCSQCWHPRVAGRWP